MSPVAVDGDVLMNKVNVALAKSQRLIASWLPSSSNDPTITKSLEQLEQEDKELFATEPELEGVGLPRPKEDSTDALKQKEITSTEKLRKQLLGKYARKPARASATSSLDGAAHGAKSTTQPSASRSSRTQVSDDEEEGRASAIMSKKRKRDSLESRQNPVDASKRSRTETPVQAGAEKPSDLDRSDEEEGHIKKAAVRGMPDTGRSSFLDQVLAERAKKKKKKKNKTEALAEAKAQDPFQPATAEDERGQHNEVAEQQNLDAVTSGLAEGANKKRKKKRRKSETHAQAGAQDSRDPPAAEEQDKGKGTEVEEPIHELASSLVQQAKKRNKKKRRKAKVEAAAAAGGSE